MLRHTPLMMAANLFNGGATAWAVSSVANRAVLGLWLTVLTLYVVFAIRSWLSWRKRGERNPDMGVSERTLTRATWHAGILAAIWAVVPLLWFHQLEVAGQVLVATLVTGMICAGGFALATVPRAAACFTLVLALGGASGVVLSQNPYGWPLVCLLAVYGVTVMRSASDTARVFADRFRSEAELQERRLDIELLLNAFEESGSDWLFELDEALVIVKCSPRLGEVAGTTSAALLGTSFTALLTPSSRGTFVAAVAAGRPFRDLMVEALPGGRWWSLAAKPLGAEPRLGARADAPARIGLRGVGSDVTQKKLAQDELVWLSRTDPLTSLKNRTAFREISSLLLETARRGQGTLALACLDLDGFKAVNDSLGHPVGDQLLAIVAERLRAFRMDGVHIGRLGGDEFGVALLDRPAAAARDLLDLIIARLSEPYQIDDARITVGASAGLAMAAEGDDIDQLIRNADLALYHAKDSGRGRVTVFDPEMHREANKRRELLEDLREAIANDGLELFYQPIVAFRPGGLKARIVGFEALLRWRHPRLGLLAPGAFIAEAERSGLISALGDWVIARACADAATWDQPVRVAVNLSPAQFDNGDLAGTIRAALARSGLPADRLELEITEAMFIQHDAQAEEFMRQMAELGVGIALDDFGTGYSSLGYLARFPVQKIKIDRAFVSGQAAAARRSAIVRAVVAIAHALNMETVAEGVETEEDLAWVRDLGCSHAQGYLISRPMSLSHVPELLARDAPAAEEAA
ncbi:putative bifunctional diguanylate cyclase/phosphodiesterase [Zavarzinia sp. CC-PAN008]|uniref:putative bifunctional diguanylate cyclase/phosphodiesterase n=1 Tax=Zavarzinia sp. CC-PAN008 TaxID=3243332 RepID=UPI003F74437D